MTPHHLAGAGMLVLTALLWSLGGLLIKSVDWHPMAIAGTRSAIAIPVMLVLLGRPRITLSPAQMGGAFSYAATVVLFVLATRLTTAANAIFLQYTAPVYVALAGHWWLRERATRLDWIVIIVALGGMGLFFIDQLSPARLLGNVLALGSGISFAATALCLRKERDGSPETAIFLGNCLTALAAIPFLFPLPVGHGDGWKLLLLGTVQLGLPYVLYAIAIKRVTALEATLIPLLEPVFNPLWVMLALGERPGPWALFGGAIVLGAVLARSCWRLVLGQTFPGDKGDAVSCGHRS
jgi:drug/metabolite transporter (DMT)-like permease